MKLQLIAGIQVFQEADYIWSCLSNLYPHFDKIIVIDGAWQKTRIFAQKEGSDDGTVELVKAFPDKDKKITLIRFAGLGQEDHRRRALQEALKYLKIDDFYLMGDGDEFAKHEDWERLKKNLPNIKEDCLKFPWKLFWNDLYTYEQSVSPSCLFRITEECFCKGTRGMRYADKQRYRVVRYEDFEIFHPSYVKLLQRQVLKFSYRTAHDKKFPHIIDRGIIYRGGDIYKTNEEWFATLKTGKLEELPLELQNHYYSKKRWLPKEKLIIWNK